MLDSCLYFNSSYDLSSKILDMIQLSYYSKLMVNQDVNLLSTLLKLFNSCLRF